MNIQNIMYVACRFGHLEVVKYCVKQGVDMHACNDYALRCAVQRRRLEVVKYLVEQGVNLRVWNDWALRYAVKYNYKEIVNYLKERV